MSALLDAILASASRAGKRTAIDGADRELRYDQLDAEVNATATRLSDVIGRRSGSIAIEIDNGLDWVLADLATMKLGRAAVPMPPFFTPAQRSSLLADAAVTAIVSEDGVTLRDAAPVRIPSGTAKISYTSGSTSEPKGICLSGELMLNTARAVVDRLGVETAGIHLPVLPPAVLLENVAGLYATLLAGGCYTPRSQRTIGMADPFRPDRQKLVGAIAATAASTLILVPEYLSLLVSELEASGARLPALRLVAVGGARVPVSLLERAGRVGLPVVQGYGLTECGSVLCLESFQDSPRGTVGLPLGHARITLAPDGEIIAHGDFHLGTVGCPRVPGPIATGDLGTIDSAGRLSIIGRKSNLIVTAFGRNIAPEWVEERLVAQPQIAQALVHGDGEARLSALLVPASADADIAAGVAAANADLPAYAQIERWEPSRPFLPADGTLTANGRPRRAAILRRAASRPFFERLYAETAPARARLLAVPQLRAGLAGRIGRATYIAYLTQAYHHVRHTVPLMRLARAGLEGKPLLTSALDDYIAEEEGHEQWILNDIRAAGGDADAAVAAGPSTATAEMIEHAYSVIGNGNPAAFFGMVFVLEGTSIALAGKGAGAVRDSLGLPASAFTYLTSHGTLDQDHMAFFERLVNAIDDRADENAIVSMANAMFDLFAGMFAAIPMEEDLAIA